MSNDIAIRVEDVSKRYIVGELVTAGDLKRWVGGAVRKLLPGRNGHADVADDAPDPRTIRQRKIGRHEFWALKDINFEVKRGEVLGIIGANGAGKSTLLKVLSRITAPTTGRIDLYGRVASLLEVGTGFHPELTGRENIYLNGAILGMNKAEVDKKFDEIVDFAGTEEFIDTPIKRYSSGMRVRLGFAVAAHLEPEILIVDEVLAVGDAAFQRKCLGKMEDVASSGRTVLFVSHNMASVRSLCTRGILIEGGTVAVDDQVSDAIEAYLGNADVPVDGIVTIACPHAAARAWMTQLRILVNGKPSGSMMMGSDLSLEVDYESREAIHPPYLGVVIENEQGDWLVNTSSRYQEPEIGHEQFRRGTIRCDFGALPLMPRQYRLSLWLGLKQDDVHQAIGVASFDVMKRDLWGTGVPINPRAQMWWRGEFSYPMAGCQMDNALT